MFKFLAWFDRYGKWILAVFMLLFIITGLGITKGIMDPKLAKELHENVLPVPFYFLILMHVFCTMPARLVRWKIFQNERIAAAYSGLVAFLLLFLFIWLHFR